MKPRSALYDAVLEHERYAPARNAFRYRIYQLLLDLDELDELAREIPFLSVDRRNLVEVRAADHLGDPTALDPRQRARLARLARCRACPTGRIELLTHARTFGYVFNPVSLLLRAQPRRLARVRRRRGAQHVRRALALPAGRAGRARRRRPHALQHREALPRLAVHGRLRARTGSCSASPASA